MRVDEHPSYRSLSGGCANYWRPPARPLARPHTNNVDRPPASSLGGPASYSQPLLICELVPNPIDGVHSEGELLARPLARAHRTCWNLMNGDGEGEEIGREKVFRELLRPRGVKSASRRSPALATSTTFRSPRISGRHPLGSPSATQFALK